MNTNSYKRYERLVAGSVVSLEKFDEVTAQLKSAEARLENFRSQREQLLIQQSRQIVTSSISGQILKIYNTSGSYVTTGMPVTLVGKFDKLYFKISLTDSIVKAGASKKLPRKNQVWQLPHCLKVHPQLIR